MLSIQKRTAFVNDYVLFRQKITFYAEKERKKGRADKKKLLPSSLRDATSLFEGAGTA